MTLSRVLPWALWIVTENASSNGKTGLNETSATGTKTSPVGHLNLSDSEVPPRHMDLVKGMIISSLEPMSCSDSALSFFSCLDLVWLNGFPSRVFVTFMFKERGGLISISDPNGGGLGPSRRSRILVNSDLSEKVSECVVTGAPLTKARPGLTL